MKTTTSAPANIHMDPEFKGWTPPANWWEHPKRLSSLMTFYLCRPGGIAWSEAVSIVKPYIDTHRLKTVTTASFWRSHARNWLVKPARRHNFDLTFVEDDKRGQVVHKSGLPLGQEEILKLIKEIRGAKRQNPARGARRNRRDLSGNAPVKYEPKDYDIGDGQSSVYAYYYPKYRENAEADFPIKIGRSIDYSERIKAQTTGMPEIPEVSVVWRTDQPEAAERLLHGLLNFRGKHKLDAPGSEWFRTSPDEIRQIIECIQPGVTIRNMPDGRGTLDLGR